MTLYSRLAAPLDRWSDCLLPTLARLVFAAVLAGYFCASALTKLDGRSPRRSGLCPDLSARV